MAKKLLKVLYETPMPGRDGSKQGKPGIVREFTNDLNIREFHSEF